MNHRARAAGLFLFLLTTAYLAAYASPTAITGPYRRLHNEDNNERQQIHEHNGRSEK